MTLKIPELIDLIAKRIKDDDFMPLIQSLIKNNNVDKPNLNLKLQRIHDNLSTIENAYDLVTELKVADQLAKINGVNKLIFSENPDILLEFNTFKLAIEVKTFRIRFKVDDTDEINLRNYTGELKVYGDPENVQIQIEEVIKKKMKSYKGNDPYYIYLWSDSPYQVENSEILCAVDYLKRFPPEGFEKLKGIFYKWLSYPRNFKPIENNQINNQLKEILYKSGWNLWL